MRSITNSLLVLFLLLTTAACDSAEEEPTATPLPPTVAAPTEAPTPVPATATPIPEEEATPEPSSEPQDIVGTLISDGRFSTLVAALEEADLIEKLQNEGPYTLFAAPDTAFAALDEGTLDDPDQVFDIVLFHIVEDVIAAADIADSDTATSLLGDDLLFSVDGATVSVGGATITAADVAATNGTIHVIDAVLLPETE